MSDNLLKSKAFKLKGRLYTFTVLSVLIYDHELMKQQLSETIAQAPKLFDKTAIILDCSGIDCSQIDLQAMYRLIRELGLIPVGIQGGDPHLDALAYEQGLAVLHASSTHDKPVIDSATDVDSALNESLRNKLISTPVRSGQQVVSKGDLIITAAVSHGAELLADGCIHVYGPLRGRALAGLSGNKQARIFCQALEAELISIAGYYRLSDAIESHAGPCQIYLKDDHIHIEHL
ncbi:MAG: septum site-determining protein MinC [Legionella sp.]